jgi:simple sugar transport system substrate-binding protein
MGVEVNYRELDAYDIPQLQRNLESAIAAEPDGMVVSIPDPNALTDTIREAADDGIPIVVANSGEAAWRDAGALTYVGQTEFDAGVAAGERMAQEGVQNALCVNHEQGNVALDDRCDGFAEGLGGEVEQVAVTTDPTAARNGIATALRQNESVEGMLTLNPGVADQGLRALEESGRANEITFATFDLSPSVLEAVRDGDMLFATDQQQYLQGYLPVTLLTNYIQYGVRPVDVELPTGPAFITEENAEQVIQLSREGLR